MKDNFEEFWQNTILKWEGGGRYHKVALDSGGGTKWGVSDAADGTEDGMIDLDRDGKGDVLVSDLSEEQAKEIYKKWYLDKIKFDQLPDGVDTFLADMAVNQGTYKASIALQEAIGAEPDGIVGSNTLKAVLSHTDTNKMLFDIAAKRMYYYQTTTAYRALKYNNHEDAIKFSKGWSNRYADILSESVSLINYKNNI